MKLYRFLKEAHAEFQEQISYFDQQPTPGLGDRFIADVAASIRDIREYPESGSLFSRNVRKRVLHTFKYNVFYLNEPEEIVIVAIAPHPRRPGYWRKRLRALKKNRNN